MAVVETPPNPAIRFLRRHPNVCALFFGIVFCVALLFTLEIAAGILLAKNALPETVFDDGFIELNAHGIAGAPPNAQYRAYLKSRETGATIYDITYKTDSFGRRRTPVENLETRSKFIQFFGGSFAYGEGLEENETIPFFVGAQTQDYIPYNYAFHGASPTEMLARLESGTLPAQVKEQEGTLVYIFISAHVQRVIGSMRVAGTWGFNRPYFYLDSAGNVVRKENFSTGRPVLTKIFHMLAKSKLLAYFDVNIPLRISDPHVEMTARVIQKARDLYLEQFPDNNFYVVIYPGAYLGPRLIPFLERMDIDYLNYLNLIDRNDPQYWLSEKDKHPSAFANEVFAQKLVSDLKLS